MNQPPSSITFELEDKDIRSGLISAINALSKIRAESIKDRVLSDRQKDEYLHLVYRLASDIEAVADEGITKRMQSLAGALTKNPALLKYDPMQDGYWKRKEKKFSETLEELLIETVRDKFHTIDTKHHILQAIKYLGSKESEPQKREKILDTILPFHWAVGFEKEGTLKRILGALFGSQYQVSDVEGLVLGIDASKGEFAEEFIDMAKERGYTALRVELKEKEWQRLNGINESLKVGAEVIGIGPGIVGEKHMPIAGLRGKIVHIGEGGFGIEWEKNIGGHYCSGHCQNGYGWYVDREYFNIIRDDEPNKKIPFKVIDSREVPEKGRIFTVEIPVRTIEPPKYVPSAFGFYDSIGKKEAPEKIERNLIWDDKNHAQFGKYFIAYMKKHICAPPKEIDVSTKSHRPSQSVIYTHKLEIDGYRKNSSIFCFKDRRYLITAISSIEKGNAGFVDEASVILSSDLNNNEKLEKIARKTGAKYIHLREYQRGKLTGFLEGFA